MRCTRLTWCSYIERELEVKIRVLQYVQHLVLTVEHGESTIPFQHVRPEQMPLLNEITMNFESDHKECQVLVEGLTRYTEPVKVNLYIYLQHNRGPLLSEIEHWNKLNINLQHGGGTGIPLLTDIGACKTLNIQTLVLKFRDSYYTENVFEPIRHLKNLRTLRIIAYNQHLHEPSLTSVSAMSAFFHELENLEHLTLDIPADGFIWNLPPKVQYLKVHLGLFRKLPNDLSMFSGVTALELDLSHSSRETLLDFDFPFTSLKSLMLYTDKDSEPFIRRLVASNPGLINIGFRMSTRTTLDFSDGTLLPKSVEHINLSKWAKVELNEIISKPHPNLRSLSICYFKDASIDFDILREAVSPVGTCPKLCSVIGDMPKPIRLFQSHNSSASNEEEGDHYYYDRRRDMASFTSQIKEYPSGSRSLARMYIDTQGIRESQNMFRERYSKRIRHDI